MSENTPSTLSTILRRALGRIAVIVSTRNRPHGYKRAQLPLREPGTQGSGGIKLSSLITTSTFRSGVEMYIARMLAVYGTGSYLYGIWRWLGQIKAMSVFSLVSPRVAAIPASVASSRLPSRLNAHSHNSTRTYLKQELTPMIALVYVATTSHILLLMISSFSFAY